MSFDKKDFSHYTYEVGRYYPSFTDDKKTFVSYKEDKSKLVWNVIACDSNCGIRPYNVFKLNWTFTKELLKIKKKYKNNFKRFADEVRRWLQYEMWARTEYEVLISKWPNSSLYQKDLDELQADLNKDKEEHKKNGYDCEASTQYVDPSTIKIDVYTQVMLNWDQFIHYLWDNKRLITAKKLGLSKEK